jgi:prepilin-type N-terminal cleavage/methylation domain-containing protein
MISKPQNGFTLLETMVSLAVFLGVSGIVMSGMVEMMKTQSAIGNRTEMHASVRSATELLQQEIGQAGKISLGPPNVSVTMAPVLIAGSNIPIIFTPSTGVTVYPGEYLTVDLGNSQEVVAVTGTSASPSATFVKIHPSALTPVVALGAFASGVVPPDAASITTGCANSTLPTGGTYPGYPNGSTCTKLKLYGDVNGDGNIVYIEYTCSQGTITNPGFLYRNQMLITAASKPANDNTMILLGNVLGNPNDANNNPVPCFNYQVRQIGNLPNYCVTNVALTLTVQTQNKDQQTQQFQPETKALLNVGPRNVIEVWGTANLVDSTRAQSMPASVTALLP